MRLLLTRPRRDSEELAATLHDLGVETLIAPVIEIHALPFAPPAEAGHQAVLLTSGNAVPALSESVLDRDIAAYCVGDATGRRLAALGFSKVRSAAGDAGDLAELVCEELDPGLGPLLHMSGTLVAGDLAGTLAAAGFEVDRRVVYRADPIRVLDEAVAAAFVEKSLDGVLLFSPRSARILVRLLKGACLAATASDMTAYCMSRAVAEVAEALTWRKVAVAARPNQLDLLALLPN